MDVVKQVNYTERFVINGKLFEFRVLTIKDQEIVDDLMERELRINPKMSESRINRHRSLALLTLSGSIITESNGEQRKDPLKPAYFETIPVMEVNELIKSMNITNQIKKKSEESSIDQTQETIGS